MAIENKNQLLIIVGAVAVGLVAVVMTSNYVKTTIQGQTQALAEQYDAKQKEVASEIIQRDDQQLAAVRQELEQTKVEEAAAMQKQMAAFQAQQQAMQAQQAQQQAPKPENVRKPSIALKTPAGKRAVTIRIDSLAAVGGLINPGDFVDIIGDLNVPGQEIDKKTVTAMIFQGLEVLAVNTNVNDPGDYDDQQAQPSLRITLAVDPQEAGLLSFADKNGSLELALRSPDDTDHETVKANTWKTLADYVLKNQGLDIQNPDGAPTEGARTPESKPEIFRGGKEL